MNSHPAPDDDVELGEEETGTSIGKKYERQMRELVTQRLDIPVPSLAEMIDRKRLDLQPDFQRRSRWNDQQRSRLIESIIMNVPIPPVFLGEDKYGKYVVLDGRQRLTAIDGFMRGSYALQGIEVWEELNGKTIGELGEVSDYITRRFIPAVVILRESSKEIKYDVFDRLNTGGVVLAPMELRNALFRGPFTETIRELSEAPAFLKLWGIPTERKAREQNSTYQKMTDMELVLRFFALRNYRQFTDRTKLKGFLSDYMRNRNEDYERDAGLREQDLASFDRAINCTWIVFRETAFRKPKTKKRSIRSAPLADAVMFAFRNVDPSSITDEACVLIKRDFEELFASNEAFVSAVSEGTNGRAAVVTRLETMESIVKQHVAPVASRRRKVRSRKSATGI